MEGVRRNHLVVGTTAFKHTMSSDALPNRARFHRWKWIGLLLGLVCLYFARLAFAPSEYRPSFIRQFFYDLPVGWWAFLKRTAPNVTIEISAIAFAVIAAVVLGALVHWCGRAFFPAWTWRSTVAASAAPLLLFAIILSTGGISKNAKALWSQTEIYTFGSAMSRYEWKEIEDRLRGGSETEF